LPLGTVSAVIWLLRHGEAEDGSPDEARRLTPAGESQARAAGRALANAQIRIDCCLTSPRIRALETARLACEPLAVKVEVRDELSGGPIDPEELAAGRGEVLLVGHDPDLSTAVHDMTGAQLRLAKGGLAGVDRGELQ
jgi:phosphohistidine phosphatase